MLTNQNSNVVIINISASRKSECDAILSKLLKKATKLGYSFSWSFGKAYVKDITIITNTDGQDVEIKSKRLVVPVSVCGDILNIKVNGWDFFGSVTMIDGMKMVSGRIPSDHIKNHNFDKCDHCKSIRQRNKTFLVFNSLLNEFKWVGSTCIKDFVGRSIDQELTALTIYETIIMLDKVMNDDLGKSGSEYWPLSYVLAISTQVINSRGWVSKAKSQETNCLSSYQAVLDLLKSGPVQTSEQDVKDAEDAASWAEGMSDSECEENGYLTNIREIAKSGYCSTKLLGLVVSIVGSFIGHKARLAAREKAGVSKHVGTVGKREKFIIKCYDHKCFDTAFGQQVLFLFSDKDGNTLTWKTSGSTFPCIGDKALVSELKNVELVVTATVKGHSQFNGVLQTEIIRCKLALPS